MQVEIKHRPSEALAVVTLSPRSQLKVEPGAMVSFSADVVMETKVEGGLFGGLKRMVGGESFFQNTYTAPAEGGEITLAPPLMGDVFVTTIERGRGFYLQSGAYMASDMGVSFDTSWGGSRGFFGAGSLLLLKVSGEGDVLAACYGALEERVLAVGQRYNVDTGHIVGFDETVQFRVRGSGGVKNTVFGGEGLIVELTGPGRVLMQTRSEGAFISWLTPKLPSRSN